MPASHLINFSFAQLNTYSIRHKDAGATWGAPRNLSAILPPLRPNEGEWIVRTAGGGGNGIRISSGPHKGRLVVPGYHG